MSAPRRSGLDLRLPARLGTVSTLSSETTPSFDQHEVRLHGREVMYSRAGEGPPIVLIHGMLNSSRHWKGVAQCLARAHTVVAPDLIGHGESAAPRGDYSLGAHAASIRDLLTTIGIERATIVGHSLGGGVALQFFYQFPQRTERLALVSSGGLGADVSPLLRAAALPGAEALLGVVAQRRTVEAIRSAGDRLRARGSDLGVQLQAIARAMAPLQERPQRSAFLNTLRSVIDIHGQKVSAMDRMYLLRVLPVLIVWGERDHTIPQSHGEEAHRAIPGSRFATIPSAAHFPHLEAPAELALLLEEWITTTEPAPTADSDWVEVVNGQFPARLTRERDEGSLRARG